MSKSIYILFALCALTIFAGCRSEEPGKGRPDVEIPKPPQPPGGNSFTSDSIPRIAFGDSLLTTSSVGVLISETDLPDSKRILFASIESGYSISFSIPNEIETVQNVASSVNLNGYEYIALISIERTSVGTLWLNINPAAGYSAPQIRAAIPRKI